MFLKLRKLFTWINWTELATRPSGWLHLESKDFFHLQKLPILIRTAEKIFEYTELYMPIKYKKKIITGLVNR